MHGVYYVFLQNMVLGRVVSSDQGMCKKFPIHGTKPDKNKLLSSMLKDKGRWAMILGQR